MNTPPFRIGQKVVCVEDNPLSRKNSDLNEEILLKNEYAISDCFYLDTYSGWAVKVDGKETYWKATSFAPIEESRSRIQYVAVSESLREKAVEIAAVETN